MKVRETEIELLRIVVMILIIITHLAVWGTAKTENATILPLIPQHYNLTLFISS